MDGEEEQQGAWLALAEDLDEFERWVDGEVPRAALGCAVGTRSAEAAAAQEDAIAQGFRVGEEGCDGAIALDAGSAAAIEAQFMGEAGMGARVGDGVDNGAGDSAGEEIEEHRVEVRQGSGEPVEDLSGGEVGGAVVGVGGGEHEFLGAQALAAIDGSEPLGVQAGRDGEQLRGDERQPLAAAVVEVEGTPVETGPITAGDTSGDAVAAHRNAGRRSTPGSSPRR